MTGAIAGIIGVVLMAIPLTVLALQSRKDADKLTKAGAAMNDALRERDVLVIEKQEAESKLRSVSNQAEADRLAHGRQIASVRKDIANARKLLRDCGSSDPAITDERLLRIEESLASAADSGSGG